MCRVERCRLLELPAELREQIWTHAVTSWIKVWTPTESEQGLDAGNPAACGHLMPMLQKLPIRMDRFNRSLPPGITRVCKMTRHETLHLYYECNTFECWRPVFWNHDWSSSTLIDWLSSLGPRALWLNDLILLYKYETELEQDIEPELIMLGLEYKRGIITNKQELSEFELTHEALGLPRHFGTKRRDRW